MAKTTTGILGGMSGTIGEVTGYRRDGNNIITAKPNQPNLTLHPDIVIRNDFEKTFGKFYNVVAPLDKTRRFQNFNGIDTLSQRMADIQANWPSFTRNQYCRYSLFSHKQMATNVKYKLKFRTSDKVFTIEWRQAQVNGYTPNTTLVYWVVINFTRNAFLMAGAVRNPLLSSFNYIQNTWQPGDKMFLSMAFYSDNSANPAVMVGGYSYLQLL